jgi:hypothetical protein
MPFGLLPYACSLRPHPSSLTPQEIDPRSISLLLGGEQGPQRPRAGTPRGVPATLNVEALASVSDRMFFVPTLAYALIGLRDDTGKRRMALCKPRLLSTNSR